MVLANTSHTHPNHTTVKLLAINRSSWSRSTHYRLPMYNTVAMGHYVWEADSTATCSVLQQQKNYQSVQLMGATSCKEGQKSALITNLPPPESSEPLTLTKIRSNTEAKKTQRRRLDVGITAPPESVAISDS